MTCPDCEAPLAQARYAGAIRWRCPRLHPDAAETVFTLGDGIARCRPTLAGSPRNASPARADASIPRGDLSGVGQG